MPARPWLSSSRRRLGLGLALASLLCACAAPPPPPPAPAPAPEVDVRDRLRFEDSHKKLTALAGIWPEIVGPQLAPNTRPGQLENGCLTIFVSHPAWIFELRGAPQNEILTRLQTRCGANEIQRLRFAVDPAPPAP